jgi:hypothetical protein
VKQNPGSSGPLVATAVDIAAECLAFTVAMVVHRAAAAAVEEEVVVARSTLPMLVAFDPSIMASEIVEDLADHLLSVQNC